MFGCMRVHGSVRSWHLQHFHSLDPDNDGVKLESKDQIDGQTDGQIHTHTHSRTESKDTSQGSQLRCVPYGPTKIRTQRVAQADPDPLSHGHAPCICVHRPAPIPALSCLLLESEGRVAERVYQIMLGRAS